MTNILITGASSGIGESLAKIYNQKQNTLFLISRNEKKLTTLKNTLKTAKKVEIHICDVTDSKKMAQIIQKIQQAHQLDLVIANAGISAGTSKDIESQNQVNQIFNTNLNGVLNTINPAIEFFKQRKSGQIAVVSSLAGFLSLPSCPSYSASKVAVKNYCEALMINLKNFNIHLSIICPGYIKTNMTKVNDFYMPFLMDSQKAATIIKKGLDVKKRRIIFPKRFYFIILFISFLPNFVKDFIFSKLPGKKSF